MSSHQEDLGLMVAVQGGDRLALAELYDRHSGVLVGIGVRILGSRGEAEDVVHDVFVEAWQRAGSYRPDRGSVKTWLSMRMRSRCLDRLKSVSNSRRDTMPAERPSRFSGNRLPRLVDASRALAAVEILPDEQRAVVELCYFKGLSSSEMAEQLGVPAGTVKSRMRAALGKLRDSFEA